MNRYNDIPLNEDLNNWWYFGRRKILSIKIKKYFNFKENKLNILEIGPGTGANIIELQKFGKVDILEVDDYFIELVKKDQRLEVNNVFEAFEEVNTEYDLVVILDVLEHVKDTENFLKNINSILSKNGLLILSVPAHMSLFSEHDVLLKHFRRYSMESLADELKDKFIPIEFFWYNFLLFPLRYIQVKYMKDKVNSDTSVNETVNHILKFIIRIEIILIKFGIKTSRGVSIFCLARKNK